MGTAVILLDQCLPWARDEECLICEAQCPYTAVFFQHDDRHPYGLPVIDPTKCNGCGKCEDRCPIVGDSAILVTPNGELRLEDGSYVEVCRSQGLVFEDKEEGRDQFQWTGDAPPS